MRAFVLSKSSCSSGWENTFEYVSDVCFSFCILLCAYKGTQRCFIEKALGSLAGGSGTFYAQNFFCTILQKLQQRCNFFIQLTLHIWGQGISRLLQKLVSTLLAWVAFIHPKNNFMLDKKSSAEKIIAWTRWFYANNLFLSNTKSEDWKTANLHLLWISHVKVVLTIPLECCHARRSRHLVKKTFLSFVKCLMMQIVLL